MEAAPVEEPIAEVAPAPQETEVRAPAPRRAPVAVRVIEEPAAQAASVAPPVRVVSTASEGTRVHRVQRGEYLLRIARQYGLSLEQIRALNPGVGDELEVGQRIHVTGTPTAAPARRAAPSRPSTHTVRRGDHLTGIARQYGVSISDLREWNGLSNDVIQVGQRLRLRARGSRG